MGGGVQTLPAGLHVLRSLNLTFSPLRSQPIFPLILTSFFTLSLVNFSVCISSTCAVSIYSPFLAPFPYVVSRPYVALPFLLLSAYFTSLASFYSLTVKGSDG